MTTHKPRSAFRVVRGEKANYKTCDYTTKENRDIGAQSWADADGEHVLLDVWQDGQWWNEGTVYPTGVEPPKMYRLNLTPDEAAALMSTFASADRGREDFEYLVSLGGDDYTKKDIKRARKRHAAEVETENKIAQWLRGQGY